jgi:hypothetical protein
MPPSEPCEVKIWTSSHGTDRHYFPSNLEKAFSENLHLYRDLLIQTPLIDAQPGRQTRASFVTQVKNDLQNIPSWLTRINIILMGDNDLRSNDYVGAVRVENNIGQIIDFHKDSRHGLIVCGLLPSPATWLENDFLFHRVSNRLFKLVEQANSTPSGRKIAYLRTFHIFTNEGGLLDVNRYFEYDRVHLRNEGAYRLAKHLVDNTVLIAEAFLQD